MKKNEQELKMGLVMTSLDDSNRKKLCVPLMVENEDSTLTKVGISELSNELKELFTSTVLGFDYKGFEKKADFEGDQKDWNQKIIVSLSRLSNNHFLKHGNKINLFFVSAEILSIIRDSEYYKESDGEVNFISYMLVGSIAGDTYKICLDENLQKNIAFGVYLEYDKDGIAKYDMSKRSTLYVENI